MTNQIDSPDGKPRKDPGRPSPDVEQYSTDGQSDSRGKGATDEQGRPGSGPSPGAANDRGYRGDGPGKMGLTSDAQPDLVAPSGVNERDHGMADDKPMAGDQLNFEDDEILSGRGNHARTGGTWNAQGGDSGKLGAPSAGLSDRNGPSDPDRGGKPNG